MHTQGYIRHSKVSRLLFLKYDLQLSLFFKLKMPLMLDFCNLNIHSMSTEFPQKIAPYIRRNVHTCALYALSAASTQTRRDTTRRQKQKLARLDARYSTLPFQHEQESIFMPRKNTTSEELCFIVLYKVCFYNTWGIVRVMYRAGISLACNENRRGSRMVACGTANSLTPFRSYPLIIRSICLRFCK